MADMRGLKWRAYSPATAKIAELVGAQPVTVQAAELSQALATGVVDSYMRPAPPATTPRPTRASRTSTTRRPGCRRTPCSVNQKAFDALDKPTQDAVAQGRRRGRKPAAGSVARKRTSGTRAASTKNGMKIIKPSPKLTADMKQVGGDHAGRLAEEGRPGRRGRRRRLSEEVSAHAPRRWTRLYDAGRRYRAAFFVLAIFVLMIGRASACASSACAPAARTTWSPGCCAAAAFFGHGACLPARRLRARDLLLDNCGRAAAPLRSKSLALTDRRRCSVGYLAFWATASLRELAFDDMADGLIVIPIWIPQTSLRDRLAGCCSSRCVDELVIVLCAAASRAMCAAVEERHAARRFLDV